jgi:hypothetical protein
MLVSEYEMRFKIKPISVFLKILRVQAKIALFVLKFVKHFIIPLILFRFVRL